MCKVYSKLRSDSDDITKATLAQLLNLNEKINKLMDMSYDEKDNFQNEEKYLLFTNNLMHLYNATQNLTKQTLLLSKSQISYPDKETQYLVNQIYDSIDYVINCETLALNQWLEFDAVAGDGNPSEDVTECKLYKRIINTDQAEIFKSALHFVKDMGFELAEMTVNLAQFDK